MKTRIELYKMIKADSNLNTFIKNKSGRYYSSIKTDILNDLVSLYYEKQEANQQVSFWTKIKNIFKR